MAAFIRPARPFLILAIFGATLLLFVATVAEVALRVAELRTNGTDPRCAGSDSVQLTQKGLYQVDSAAGYTMRPNLCVRLHTTEYDEVLRTNSRGMVGPELAPSKAAGEFRIVVLGDSYTVGGQVPFDQTFPAVLQDELRQRGYTHVNVINAGVGGYTTYNEAGLLREDVSWLQPDLVVVAAFLGNDVGENVLATAAGYTADPDHPKGLSYGPMASELVQESINWFPRNGQTTSGAPPGWDPSQALPAPAPTPAPAPVHPTVGPIPLWVFDKSAIVTSKNLGHWAWDSARSRSLLLGRLFGQPPNTSISTEPGARPPSKDQRKLNVSSFEWTILNDIPHTYWLDLAWPLFGAYLADARSTAASTGAPTVVLAIPEIGQVVPRERARTMADYRFSEGEVDWDRPQRDLSSVAQQVQVPLIDLLPAFRARSDRDALYLPLDQHFSALGHRATAQILADALIEDGLVRP